MSKNFCLIPAKAASTRLKKKNILPINGKPMIHYPIQTAIDSGLFGDEVFVSTESPEVQSIAESCGAKVPYLREEYLAHNPSKIIDVAWDFLEKNPRLQEYDYMTVLLPTSPLLSVGDLLQAFEKVEGGAANTLHSVTESNHNVYAAFTIQEHKVCPLFQHGMTKQSQEWETTYRFNGAIAIVRISCFMQSKHFQNEPIIVQVMPRERSVDVDTEFDYKIAKAMIEHPEWFNPNT